jgi:alpha-L-fucosidase
VVNNSSSDRPGVVRYPPVDIRTSEHYDFIWQERAHEPVIGPVVADGLGNSFYLPLEFCTSLNPDWFWMKDRFYSHPSAETIAYWHRTARAAGGNLLLNAGPNAEGLIPDYHRRYLLGAERLLR